MRNGAAYLACSACNHQFQVPANTAKLHTQLRVAGIDLCITAWHVRVRSICIVLFIAMIVERMLSLTAAARDFFFANPSILRSCSLLKIFSTTSRTLCTRPKIILFSSTLLLYTPSKRYSALKHIVSVHRFVSFDQR